MKVNGIVSATHRVRTKLEVYSSPFFNLLENPAPRLVTFSGVKMARKTTPTPRAKPGITGYNDDVKVRDALRMVQLDGWTQVRRKVSHRQFHHPTKPGTVTVAGHPSLILPMKCISHAQEYSEAGWSR